MKTLAVIAADGRSGSLFVERALSEGYQVRAGVRGKHRLEPRPNLITLQCDATDNEQVARLLEGSDAVVSFIGHQKHSPARVQTEAMRVIVRQMKKLGIKRVVSLTGTGVRFKGDVVPLLDRIVTQALLLVDYDRVKDGILHAEVLKRSGLDWTILRVMKLQDVKPSPFTLKEHGPTKLYVSRRDVAEAAIQVLRDESFVGSAPILSK